MKNKLVFPLLALLLTGCNSSKYNLAYQGIDLILKRNYGQNIIIEECYYFDDDALDLDIHLIYNFSFINKYDQRINRYFMYMDNGSYDEFYNAEKYYEIAITTDYYLELDIDKLNEYIKEKN